MSSHGEEREDQQASRAREAHPSQEQGDEWRTGTQPFDEARAQEYEAAVLAAEPPSEMPEVWQGQSEPWWPSMEDALSANQQAYQEYGQGPWGGVIGGKEGSIDSALNSAKQHYYYGPEEDEGERLAVAAAKMAHRLHANQAFVDANKRTAYVTTKRFLDLNGLGHLSPIDQEDEELADHLIGQDWKNEPQYGHLYKSEGDFINMMRDRYLMGGPRQGYVPVEWPNREGQQQGQTFLDRPQSSVHSNILDPIHDELDPSVWDTPAEPQPKLRADHSKWIWHLVTSVLDKHGYDGMDKWLDIVFTGSLTTYQYSEESDADVSLFVDTEIFPEWSRAEMIGIMISETDGKNLPGTTHPMQCYVVSSSLTKEDLYKPGMRSGYDMKTNTWVVPPEKDRVHDVEHEMNISYTEGLEAADKMEKLLRYEPDKAVMYWHQIHKRRMSDMQKGKGDYSTSNIIYKTLANRGLFPQIAEASGEYLA